MIEVIGATKRLGYLEQGRIHGTRCASYAYFSPSSVRPVLFSDGATDGHDLLKRCDGASKNAGSGKGGKAVVRKIRR